MAKEQKHSHFYQFPSNRGFIFWNCYFDSYSSQIHKLFAKLKLGEKFAKKCTELQAHLSTSPARILNGCRLLQEQLYFYTIFSYRSVGGCCSSSVWNVLDLCGGCGWSWWLLRKQELEIELNSFYIYERYNLSFMDWWECATTASHRISERWRSSNSFLSSS